MSTNTNQHAADASSQAALRRSERRFRALIEHSHDAIVFNDQDGKITYASPSIQRIIGYTPEECLGLYAAQAIHPADQPLTGTLFTTLLKKPGQTVSTDYRIRHKNGSWVWVEGTWNNLLADPDIGAIVINIHDITDRKHAETQLRESEEKYRLIVESIEDIVSIYDIESKHLYLSPAITKALGYTPEELLGTPALSLLHPDDIPAATKELQTSLTGKPAFLSGYRVRHKNGEWRYIESSSNAMYDAQGKPYMIIGISRDITEQRQAEEAQRLLAAIVTSSDDAIISKTLAGVITSWNTAAEHLFGYTAEEAIGRSITMIIPPELYQEEEAIIRKLRKGQPIEHFETVRLRKDGTSVAMSLSISPIKNRQGKIIGAAKIGRDITRQKEPERKLREQAMLLQLARDAFIVQNNENCIVFWSEGASSMYGWTQEEALGKKAYEMLHTCFPQPLSEIHQTLVSGKTWRGELVHITREGKQLTVDSQWRLVGEEPSLSILEVNRDITERKHLEDELHRSKQQLEVIFENIADGISVQDDHGSLIYINEAGAKLCGYPSASEVLETAAFQAQEGKTLQRFDMRDEQDNPFPYSELPGIRALRGERDPQAIVQYYDSVSQTRHWSMVKARPIFDETGRVQLVVNIFSDITASYEAERRKDEFISIASHELKTPVTSLKGFASVLQRRLSKQGDDQGLTYLAKMDRQLNKLTSLISELLDISRMQTGKLVFRDDIFDLSSFVQETVDNLQQATSTHHLCLEQTEPVQVVGDRDRLGQVLINLITNAVKYSPRADKVIVRIASDQHQAIVSVQDFGIGIANEYQQKIFERFYQVTDPEERTYPGLGIGLYISHEIVKRHGGRIWVESTKGNGATFYVSLPLSNEHA